VLRQVIHEDGEWHCVLGSVWPLPAWLDDTIEFTHADLPLAILGALVAAIGAKSAPGSTAGSLPRPPAEPRDIIGCIGCDNFA
jgi:hypothetical protein